MIQNLIDAVISEFEIIDTDIKNLQEKEIELQQKISNIGDSYSLKDIEKTSDLRNKLNLVNESLTKAIKKRETMSHDLSNDIRNKMIEIQQEYKKDFRANHKELKEQIIDTSKEFRRLIQISKDISYKAKIDFKKESRKLIKYLDDQSQKDFDSIGIGFNLVPDFETSENKADLKIINYIIKESKTDANFNKNF